MLYGTGEMLKSEKKVQENEQQKVELLEEKMAALQGNVTAILEEMKKARQENEALRKLHQFPGNWYVLGRNNDNTNKGLGPKPEMIGKNTLGEKFRKLFRRLKEQGRLNDITGLQFYSLKDTLAVGMLDAGIDVESAMRHLRQRDLETFQRYVKRLGIVNEKIRAMPLRVPILKK